MKKDFNSSFPKNLELWMEGDTLKYRAEEEALDSSKLDFLKSNKEFFRTLLARTRSETIKVLPLAHNQKALWFLQTVRPDNSSYNISLTAEVKNPIVIDAVRVALKFLTERHEMLRTVFAYLPESESLACQIVLDHISEVVEQVDGSNLSDDQLQALLQGKSNTPYNFEIGPLFRVIVVNAPNSTILSFNFHHIICDAFALRNLLSEFIALYDSLIQNKKIEKVTASADYGDFIFDQIEFLNSDRGADQLDYWVKQVAGKIQNINLPGKFERPPIHQFKGSTLLFRIEGDRYRHLRSISKKNGVRCNVLLLSLFEFHISKISQQSDFFIGLPASSRTNKDYENVFGYFINLLPLACSISSEQTFIDLLNENKSRICESLENQSVPFPVIVERVSPKRDLSRTPVFQVMFNYMNRKSLGCLLHFIGDHETTDYTPWGPLLIKPWKIFDQEGQVDLTLEITDDDKKLLCTLKYNSDLFDRETADSFKNEFLAITDLIINDENSKPEWLSGAPSVEDKRPVMQLNITGTFTVEPIKPSLEFWFDKFGITPSIVFPGYTQVFSQLLNPASEFNTNRNGYNILLIRLEDWIKKETSGNTVSGLNQTIKEFNDALSSSSQINRGGKYIIALCPSSPRLSESLELSEIIRQAEHDLASSLGSRSDVYLISSTELINTYDVSDYYEELGEEMGHIPYTEEFFISLATIISRKIRVSFRSPFKAIAVDCDNTLWKGVIAEDGPSGVTIGEPESALQQFLVDQFNSGILICLCSKNIEKDVFEVFELNSQMILKREHIAFHRINWNPKSQNLIQLAKEINIGLDSFVFIDDSPVECAEVRNSAPEVLTVQVPADGFSLKQLQNSWIFDRHRITDEDRVRSEKYREEAVRTNYKSSVTSYSEFINGLNLQIETIPFQEEDIPRISQLTYKTNQFNFTTLKRSEAEIKIISEDYNYECFQVSLSDRFGDYGLIGVIIADKQNGYSVDTFLLSCRVLGKGVEHSLISFLGQRARMKNSSLLSVNFRKTAKNVPAQDFLVGNFGEPDSVIDGLQTFDIPVERAIGFTFDPERTSQNQAAGAEEKAGVTNEKTEVSHEKSEAAQSQSELQGSHDFYYMILDRYLSLGNLIAEMNVMAPGHPEHSGLPGSPGHPDKTEHPDRPGHPGHPDKTEHPDRPGHPGSPGHPEHPDHPGLPGLPGHPDHPKHPDQPDQPDQPGHPGHPDHPGHPKHPDHPGHPKPGSGSSKSFKETEKNVMSVWQQVLKSENFASTDNFFDIGGHSVLIPQIVIKLFRQYKLKVDIVDIFQFPTVRELASFIDNGATTVEPERDIISESGNQKPAGNDIAIIGMAGRFSGVGDIEEFWNVISTGKETLTYYTKEELLEKGVDQSLLENRDYVLANGNMDTADQFDSAFFGIAPREADFMDPQHRVFLESCYEALENAGYTSEKYSGDIGVFAGSGMNNYLMKNLFQHPESLRSMGEFQTIINNNSDYLTTRVSYKMNLTGPSIDIQTACSTSLVAIHIACQNLIGHNCDIALAGGVFIPIPRAEGYMYEPGGIFSSNGHCRPFDSEADGTLFGEGTGIVVLKRLDDAIRDCDTISAVIKGSAINNDGSGKVGYMAPSVNGQTAVVRKALAAAGVSPDSVSYIETHGTGTKLGDPIEVSALNQLFKKNSDGNNQCALGSVKANIGHLDAAAGVAGLIKVAMMLKNRKIPPQINYIKPNTKLPLKDSPFYINTSLKDWEAADSVRRAGVSSFGIGGTNAHCILEEAPVTSKTASAKKYHLLPVTAKTQEALKVLENSISQHIETSDQDIGDISFTLQQGRTHYKHRSLMVYRNEPGEKPSLLMTGLENRGTQKYFDPKVVFMFTGQGSQYAGMAEDLYNEFSSFRDIVDRANLFLQEYFNIDLLRYILNSTDDAIKDELNQTSVAQPLLFVVQYGVSRLLMEFGITPDALIGHSIGEYTAATVSGVFEFEDALKLVAWRGKLMQEQKPGAMLSVQLPYNLVLPYVSGKVNLSLKNAPDVNVLSGEINDITEVQQRLAADYPDIHLSKLKTSHAFHSFMMEPVIEPFNEVLATVRFGESKIPIVSSTTGRWVSQDDLSSSGYWADQIRSTVNFSDGVQELLKPGNTYFIEVGPGNSLATLLSHYASNGDKIDITSTMRHPNRKQNDVTVFLKAVAQAWVSGADIDWSSFYKDEKRSRVPLPGYPFDRKRHWIDPVTPFNYFSNSVTRRESDSSVDAKAEFSMNDPGEINDKLHERPLMANDYIPPASETESLVVEIWEELLGIRGIGLDDDFFFLGGHSLLASQVINRISGEFHISLPLETLFSTPTIKGLVAKMESTLPTTATNPEKIASDPEGMLPVSFDQKRLWIINQIDRNNPAYNIPFTYRLKGKLNNRLFVKSLNILFQRQSILRSSIRSLEGEPYCIIHNYESIPVSYPDFSVYTPEMVESEIQKFFSIESREPFDIEEGPLFRIYLAKVNDTETIFHMTVQHMVFDGWSWGIFAGELRQIYNNLLVNSATVPEPLKYQYYDLANWQENGIDKADLNNLADYWKTQLKESPSEINFPLDRRRPKAQSGLGRRQPLKLSAEISNKLRLLGQSENATVFMTLLSAFGLLLQKYSGDNDICIGAPTANRDNLNLEGVIGLFVNTIILRLRFNEKQSFRDLLRTTRETTLEALTHKNMPFEKLVEMLRPDRKTNINPIAQILFAYQNTPRPPLSLKGIEPERILIKETISPFDMTLYAWEENGIIEGELEYNSEILDDDTIVRLSENFENLLNQIIKEPEAPASKLSLLSENEVKRIESFRGDTTEYPKDKTIVQLFQEQAQLYPDKKAVIYKKVEYTYRELDERSDKLAETLIEMGVKPHAPVGLLTDKSAEMVVAILAILKAGGGYVPIDPEYPKLRIDFMIKDSDCKVILMQDKYMNIPLKGVKRVSLDSPDSYIARKHSAFSPGTSSDLAYIMYTSGTTGKPKGSLILQYSVVRLVRNTNYIELTPSDRILLTGAIVFDATTFEIWGALLNGASLYIVDKETILDTEAIGEELSVNKITILWLTTSLFNHLADRRSDIFSGLKYLLVGGDVVSATHINLVRERNPRLKFIHCYGPTENTTFSTTFLVEKDYEAAIPIGKSISNSTVYIFDQCLKYQPIGVIGELFVGGDGVANGYLKRDDLNKKSFISNPHKKGDILYRTGDNARWLPDGNIEFHGRRDNQLKIRGFRVEVEEIEAAITETDGVIEAVVKPFQVEDGEKRLAAFLNVKDSFRLNGRELRNLLKDKLPVYMIPSNFTFMHGFPRTINGKTDKQALKVEINHIPVADRREAEKLTKTETTLLQLWNDCLRVEGITIDDNFFEIGGNSLLAISLFSKIESAFNTKLDLRTFFDSPRIREIGEIMDIRAQSAIDTKPANRAKVYAKIVKGEI